MGPQRPASIHLVVADLAAVGAACSVVAGAGRTASLGSATLVAAPTVDEAAEGAQRINPERAWQFPAPERARDACHP